jgi:hypothetical protein
MGVGSSRVISRQTTEPSALTHSADSQSESGVRICVYGTDSMRVVEYVGQKPA